MPKGTDVLQRGWLIHYLHYVAIEEVYLMKRPKTVAEYQSFFKSWV